MSAFSRGFLGFPNPLTRSGLPDFVWLAKRTANNSATLDFTELSALYDAYAFEFLNLLPANNSETLMLRLSQDGGATYDASASYQYTNVGRNQAGTDTSSTSAGTTQLRLTGTDGISNVAGDGGVCGRVRLFGANAPSARRHVLAELSHYQTVNGYNFITGGGNYGAALVNGARFFMNTGNITSGSIQLYGLRKYAV